MVAGVGGADSGAASGLDSGGLAGRNRDRRDVDHELAAEAVEEGASGSYWERCRRN